MLVTYIEWVLYWVYLAARLEWGIIGVVEMRGSIVALVGAWFYDL